MFENRIQEQLIELTQSSRQAPATCGFVCMPGLEQSGMAWMYRMAFEDAQREVQSDRRSRMLLASLN